MTVVSMYKPFDEWDEEVVAPGKPVTTYCSYADITDDTALSAVIVRTAHRHWRWAYDVVSQSPEGDIHLDGGLADTQAAAMLRAAQIARHFYPKRSV